MISSETLKKIFPNIEESEGFKSGATQGTFKVKVDGEYYVAKVGKLDMYLYLNVTPLLIERDILTPRIFEAGRYKDLDYVLMEYIDGINLSAKPVDDSTFENLSLMLRKIHTIKGKGYGKIRGRLMEGEYSSFSEYIQESFLKKVEFNKENLSYHLNRIEESLSENSETVFCHMDFSTNNILEREGELYLIDYGNEAGFNSPMMDIAKAIVNDSRYGEDVLNAYHTANDFDLDLLYSFIYIVGLRKIVSWKKREKNDRIGNLLEMFKDKVEFT